jgi:glucosamine--fructose-6-phosphate aminotransferase (isomerizing)
VIVLSQSGESADALDAVAEAKKRGAQVLAITNVMGSTITRQADKSIYLNAGPEICVLATKSYTAQLTVLLTLAYALNGNEIAAREAVEVARNTLYNISARSTRDNIAKLAQMIKDKEHLFIVGRGANYPSALEAALKIKEVSYIHAEGFAGGELKHGTIALIEKGTPCIVLGGGEDEKEIISNAQELKARGAFIIGVGPKKSEVYDFFIKVPECGIANAIAQAIPMQILAYQLAVLRGHDPDKPRNLAKSVTVR